MLASMQVNTDIEKSFTGSAGFYREVRLVFSSWSRPFEHFPIPVSVTAKNRRNKYKRARDTLT